MPTRYARNFGPLLLTATNTTNIYQGGKGGTAGFYDLIKHMRIVNRTNATHLFNLWLSTTGDNTSGKELALGKTVDPNDYEDIFFPAGLRMDTTDFLVGGADAGSSLVIMGFGEFDAL